MNPVMLAGVMVNDAIAGSCGRAINFRGIDKVIEIGACREWILLADKSVPGTMLNDMDLSGYGFGFCLNLLGRNLDDEMQNIGREWKNCHEDIMSFLEEEYAKVTTPTGRPKKGETRNPEDRKTWRRRGKMRDAIAYTTKVIEESRKHYV